MDGLLGYTNPEDGEAAAARPLAVRPLLGDALGLLVVPLPFTVFFLDMAPMINSAPSNADGRYDREKVV